MIIRHIKDDFFKEIQNNSVLLISAISIDALCCVKIMTSLLTSENIRYALSVVESIEELVTTVSLEKRIYKCMLLINCGGNLEISELLDSDDDLLIFIIDNHFPCCLKNIYSSTIIRLILNSNENIDRIPEFNLIFSEGNDENFDEDRANILIKDYERCFYYGFACSMTMFDVASKLGKDNIEFVWYAILGVTEMFILRRIGSEKYKSDCLYLQQQLVRLGQTNNDQSGKIYISMENSIKFYFYSHWTLMDSIITSPVPASFFQIWSLNGRKRLQSFLADMGIPLTQARNSYSAMDSDLRMSLRDLVMNHSIKFGLNDLSYISFVAQFGYRCKINATDFVLILISYIEIQKEQTTVNRSKRFLSTLDLLNILNISLIEENMLLTRNMLKSVAESVEQFMALHCIICAGPFLFGTVNEDNNKYKFIANPLVLDIVASFSLLSHTNMTRSRRAKELPFIITIPISETDNSVVLGIPQISSKDMVSNLHQYFKKAIANSKIKIISHGFYPAYFIIETSHLTRFFDSLVSVMQPN